MNAELFQLDARRIGIISEVLADLLESPLEQVVDVLSRQCRRLKVLHLMLRGELPRFVRAYLSLVIEVALVADKHFLNVHICILVDALQPVLYIIEGILIGQIENHYHSVALTVEA